MLAAWDKLSRAGFVNKLHDLFDAFACHNVSLVLVFDGTPPAAKDDVLAKRAAQRDDCGHARHVTRAWTVEAVATWTRSQGVSRKAKVEWAQAPEEADSQLAHLYHTGCVAAWRPPTKIWSPSGVR